MPASLNARRVMPGVGLRLQMKNELEVFLILYLSDLINFFGLRKENTWSHINHGQKH